MAAPAAAPAATTTSSTLPDNNVAANDANNAAVASSNPGIFGSTAPATTSGTNTITSSQLSPTTPVNLPAPTPPNLTAANSLVAGGQQTSTSVDQYVSQLTPSSTPLDDEQQQLLDTISSETAQDTGKDAALLAAQNQSGATQDQANLVALNNQLKNQTAQYANEQANLGGNNGVETSAVLAAQNAGLTKARAADIGLTTAQIQAMQGNLSLAMTTAQNAVDAQYSTIEDNIKVAQSQLAAIQPLLTKEQATTALAQKQVLTDQANAVAAQKAATQQINAVALQAASAGASPDVIAAINNAPDVISAIALATPALGAAATQKLQQQQFTDNVTLQQLAISKAQEGIAAENADTNRETADLKNQELINESSGPALLSYAQQYQATGVMPAQAITDGLSGAVNAIATGQGTSDGKAAIPLPVGTIINNSTQVADSKLQPAEEQSVTQLYNIVNNILPQLATNFAQTSSDIPFPMTNISLFGSQQKDDYQGTADSLNAAITSLTSAGILKGAASDYQKMIPDDFYGLNTSAGKRDIANLTSTLNDSLTSYLSANNLSIVGFNDSSTQDTTGANSSSSLSNFLK